LYGQNVTSRGHYETSRSPEMPSQKRNRLE
jgi:hypothetical protein